ncbi:hypothetical protein GCM10010423_77900 [Streptomyces levis]|uniref:Uncharacterized protein n=1 Tax=Streptomyces levis TaxID=285566 RepID=A0ABN3P722_9ACTN
MIKARKGGGIKTVDSSVGSGADELDMERDAGLGTGAGRPALAVPQAPPTVWQAPPAVWQA